MLKTLILGLTLAAVCGGLTHAQGIKRTPLQKV